MKTPREILLARHRAMEPKLDAVRQNAVAGFHERADHKRASIGFIASVRDFFRLPRPVWGGLAAAWLVIIALNLATRETPMATGTLAGATKSSPETLQALREQKRLFTELVGGSIPRDTEAPRPMPRPRSELKPLIAFA